MIRIFQPCLQVQTLTLALPARGVPAEYKPKARIICQGDDGMDPGSKDAVREQMVSVDSASFTQVTSSS